jgi:3-deoxy-manno-octulosonate cytidylyltransferase (CMP-KDO synthetase)
MSSVVIIPARYASTRFPGKPIVSINGKPLIQHVYENSKKSKLAKEVIVATDNQMIFDRVQAFGGKAVMTAETHSSGTDRIAEVAAKLDCDIIVNVQGDEPFIKPEMIDGVIELLDDQQAAMATLAKTIENQEDIFDPNVVKVVFDKDGYALYFSRAPIPFYRDKFIVKKPDTKCTIEASGIAHKELGIFYRHIGIYSYRRDVLLKLAKMKPVALEQTEKLEQLRALVNGFKIKVKETKFETIGIDTPEDLERAKKWLSTSL